MSCLPRPVLIAITLPLALTLAASRSQAQSDGAAADDSIVVTGVLREQPPRHRERHATGHVLVTRTLSYRLRVRDSEDLPRVRRALSPLVGQRVEILGRIKKVTGEELPVLELMGPRAASRAVPIDLTGTVELKGQGADTVALVRTGTEVTLARDEELVEALRPHAGRKVDLRCFLSALPGGDIEEILAVTPSEPGRCLMYPCGDYRRGLRQGGNFGRRVTGSGRTVFEGTWHLGEDVWLPPRTPVRSIAEGTVVYSDFSPTWVDEAGHTHWNLGNVIVIEHRFDPPVDGLEAVCSVYVHLAADRRVQVGQRVLRGQLIGFIGEDRSEENGRYPAHLHFGIHRGPYVQISPAWRRDIEEMAATVGLPTGDPENMELLKGKVSSIERTRGNSALIRFEQTEEIALFSLLVGSTAPGNKPPDIMGWCQGYGDEDTVEEWIEASSWIEEHLTPLDR